MRSGLTQEQTNSKAHRQYTVWATGDGAQTEFPTTKRIARLDDLVVKVAGLMLRPADRGTAFDYSVRGLTPSYPGDANMVKFTAAPAVAANIAFIINAD